MAYSKIGNGFKGANGQTVSQRQAAAPAVAIAQTRERPQAVAYINAYVMTADGERVRIGDSGLPLRWEKAGEAALLTALDSGRLSEDQIGQVIILEIGVPRDPNQPLELDLSGIASQP